MPQQLFLQNIIACIWDFDKSLIPGYMQAPIFDHYQVDAKKFWQEVNAKIPDEDRRVPFQNMIYIADGPSDIPVFSIVNRFGGRTFAVYQPNSKEEFSQVNRLQKQDRVQSYGEADYTQGSQTAMWIENALGEIADFIVTNRQRALGDKIGKPPKHLD